MQYFNRLAESGDKALWSALSNQKIKERLFETFFNQLDAELKLMLVEASESPIEPPKINRGLVSNVITPKFYIARGWAQGSIMISYRLTK